MTAQPEPPPTAPVALVTGGSRGIGRAVVTALAADGFDVAFCYRNDTAAAQELEKQVIDTGRRAVALQADVADPEQARGLVGRCEEALGLVTALVTSAGITRDNPLMLMTDEQWDSVLRTNLDGVYHVCRAAVFEMMKRRSGSITTISSIAGVYGNATQTNYSASKAGLIGFTKALAKEVGRYGIRVNSVAPGFVDTDMTAVLSDKVRNEATKDIPLRRFGRPEEIADLVSYVVSPRASYLTGAVLQIDGGLTL